MAWEPAFPIAGQDEFGMPIRPDKKTIAERKALNLVASLVEENITEKHITALFERIEPRHYMNLVEERFLAGMCAYPLCGKPHSISKYDQKKYAINVKKKKVYDITSRKTFCSSFCYTASNHLAKQVPIDAMWDRTENFKIHPIDFLRRESLNDSATTTIENADEEALLEIKLNQMKISSSETVKSTSEELDSDDDPCPIDDFPSYHHRGNMLENMDDDVDSLSDSGNSIDSIEYLAQREKSQQPQFKTISLIPLESLPSSCMSVMDKVARQEMTSIKKVKLTIQDWTRVCEIINEWKTKSTIELLRYDLAPKGCSECPPMISKVGSELQNNGNDEMTTKRRDELLNEEQKIFEEKVKAFYMGEKYFKKAENRVTFSDDTKPVKVEGKVEGVVDLALPMVDSVDQNKIRINTAVEQLSVACLRSFNAIINHRQQFLNKSDDLVDFVKLINHKAEITAVIRKLVSTFNLTAKNIALVPTEWTLAALLLFGSCCHCGAFDPWSDSQFKFNDDSEKFYYESCQFIFSWFPRPQDVQKFDKIVNMVDRVDDLYLPLATVNRFIKSNLPEGVALSKEARLAVSRAASVFVLYCTAAANDIAQNSNRRTITPNDVLAALHDMDFGEFIKPLQGELEEYKKSHGKPSAAQGDPSSGTGKKKPGPKAGAKKKQAASVSNNNGIVDAENDHEDDEIREGEPTRIDSAELAAPPDVEMGDDE